MTITGLKITDSLVHTEKPLQKQKPLMKKMGRYGTQSEFPLTLKP